MSDTQQTDTPLSTMTPEQKRVAIARAFPELVEWHDNLPYWRGSWSAVGEGNEQYAEFNPPTDHNASHACEELLLKEHSTLAIEYRDNLYEICGAHGDFVWHATASQRCDALIKTLGLEQ